MTAQASKELLKPVIEACARAAHEANRAYCIALGDNSQFGWLSAPEEIRESARSGARAVLENDLTPEQSHENWYAFKLANGWRYGEVKDFDAKTHPCMVPYAQLPPEQRAKDQLFGTVVRAVAAALGE